MTPQATNCETVTTIASSKNQIDPKLNPPRSVRLCQSAKKCMGNLLASPVTKNLAGVMIATGAGVTLGCPWLIGLLIAAGVGTSWMGGVGIVIGAVGIALWGLSTAWSLAQAPEEDSFCGHICEAGVMGVIGLPYAIVTAIGNLFDSSCCRNDPESKNIITQTTGANPPLSLEPGRKGRLMLQTLLRRDATRSAALEPISEANSVEEPDSPIYDWERRPVAAERQTSTESADSDVSNPWQPPPLLSQTMAKRNSDNAFTSTSVSTPTAT